MATSYVEVPVNYEKISDFLVTEPEEIKEIVFVAERLFFYDTCSFRRHSNFPERGKEALTEFFARHHGSVVLTRGILMELASVSHAIQGTYIAYLQLLYNCQIKTVLLDEEFLYDILAECFSTHARINEHLVWTVRAARNPVSTITRTLAEDKRLAEEILQGKRLEQPDIYKRFFAAVRRNKESGDDLGEELIGICVHLLSKLPGVADGKLCVLTDDKAAAGKIYALFVRTNQHFRGSKNILFSTPKLLQHMVEEGIELSETELEECLSQGAEGAVAVMGITPFDLEVNPRIVLSSKELARKIMQPNEIGIVF